LSVTLAAKNILEPQLTKGKNMFSVDQKSDFDALTLTSHNSAVGGFDRRSFIGATVGGGFALAVAPTGALLAQVIKTDIQGLDAGRVTFDVGGTAINAYCAKPAGKNDCPVVLVVQEIFGVHEYIEDTCRRFAKQGYLALAIELFQRQGDPTKYTAIPDLISNIVSKVPDAQVMTDLDAGAAWAAKNGGDGKRLGVTGFCWGGRITWLYAAHNPKVQAGVAWYGRLQGQPNPLQPKNPQDIAANLNGPVLGLYGSADGGIPVSTIDDMKTKLLFGSAASRASDFVVYDGAPHAFHADYRPSYRKEAADDGFKRCLAWFASNLKA
jgi:carboxymethylenebutenolidase